MRSRMLWLMACATAVSALACSGDEDRPDTMTADLPNRSGAAGAPGVTTPPPPPPTGNAAGAGSEVPPPPAVITGNNGAAAGNNRADAGASDVEETSDAGGVAVADAGGNAPPGNPPPANPPPGNPPPGNPPPGNPPPGNPPPGAVGFSDVFQLLVQRCGNCHGANAPGNRPRFAQTGNEAASFTATQAMSMGGTVAARIVARVTAQMNPMPPNCNNNGTCLNANEIAQLQAWVTQGAQP